MKNINSSLLEFLSEFQLEGDGNGFWDSYDTKAQWLGKSIQVSIAARSVSEQLAGLYQNIMASQEKYDTLWKAYVTETMLDKIADESDINIIQEQFSEELQISCLTMGFDKDGLVSVWFRQPKGILEHTILLYCDYDGYPRNAVLEG